MAAGDLIVRDYQYEWRGLLMGSGTRYTVERVKGLLDLPGLKEQNIDLDDRAGEFPGPAYPEYRSIQMDLIAQGTSRKDTERLLRELETAFAPPIEMPGHDPEEDLFVFKRPGRPKLMVPCRTWRRDFELDYNVAHGLADGAVALRASQPGVMDLVEKKPQFQVADGQVSNSRSVLQAGNYYTLPVITLTGEWDNPVIANDADLNRQVRLNLASSTGDTIVINFKERTVTHNGVDITESVQRPDTQWWRLLPGNNTITATRDNSGTVGTVEVAFRDTWV